MRKIIQYRLISKDSSDNNWPTDNIISPGGKILHLGIQATPGTKFNFNKPVTDGAQSLMVGVSGTYEINLDNDYATIKNIQFKFINDEKGGKYPTFVDIMYEDGDY